LVIFKGVFPGVLTLFLMRIPIGFLMRKALGKFPYRFPHEESLAE
jgi:hypothetical protein